MKCQANPSDLCAWTMHWIHKRIFYKHTCRAYTMYKFTELNLDTVMRFLLTVLPWKELQVFLLALSGIRRYPRQLRPIRAVNNRTCPLHFIWATFSPNLEIYHFHFRNLLSVYIKHIWVMQVCFFPVRQRDSSARGQVWGERELKIMGQSAGAIHCAYYRLTFTRSAIVGLLQK